MSRSLRLSLAAAAVAVPLALAPTESTAEVPIAAELPLLVTSSGQALDAFTIKTLLERAGIEHDYDPLAEAAALADYNSVVIAVGASVKGFGAAGITAETELARTREMLDVIEAEDITLIGVHIGGSDRRDGLSMQFVELVAPAADYLIVWQDGNQDGYFTDLAEAEGMPLTEIGLPIEVGNVLAPVFGK
jgi:hypothetical protein